MNTDLDALYSILGQEMALFEGLMGLLQKEKEIIVRNSLDDLHTSNNQKETILLKIRVLEETRIKIVEKISILLGKEGKELTLSGLSDVLEEPYKSRFIAFRTKMVAMVDSLREINKVNQFLVERSLQSINSFFSLLNLLGVSPQVYLPSGKMRTKEGQGGILSRKG